MVSRSGPHGELVERLIAQQSRAEQYVARYAKRADRIELTIIILSVVTSGAVWALAADALPKQFGWAGAAISTIVSFLTIYMYASGLQKKRKRALVVYTEITEFIGHVRGAQFLDESEFWDTYKKFEAELTKLRFERED
jgi:hypothetical protein